MGTVNTKVSKKFDFGGYATKYDIKCSDGRTIRKGAFKHCDGLTVPLVWMHGHDDPALVLGHALLESREDGVYAYGKFNNNEKALAAKEGVENGDITKLSIYANGLKQTKTSPFTSDVTHGSIKELSLVLAGANEGAVIDFPTLSHSDYESEGDAIIYGADLIDIGEFELEFSHADSADSDDDNNNDDSEGDKEEKEVPDTKERSVADVYNEMTDEQKTAVKWYVNEAVKAVAHADDDGETFDENDNPEGGNEEMKHNAFENDVKTGDYIAHAEDLRNDISALFADDKKLRQVTSLKDTILSHAEQTYGIKDIEFLFPEAKAISNEPDFIKRDTDWVYVFMNAATKRPFARIKTIHADITADEARAKGYTKGNRKVEEVFELLKRTTDPQTIYKKQKIDRDDMLDITDLNIVAFLKKEMRTMLDEEIARAALVSDGRGVASDDKIKEDHIRPIWTDDELYSIHKTIDVNSNASDAKKAKEFILAAIRGRKEFKGSAGPILFTTTDWLTEMLLLTDGTGRDLYEDQNKLATKLRVSRIVEVEVMEGLTRTVTESGTEVTKALAGIIVNPKDYSFGANKGGEVNMFDDFDIDFNQYKYLMETRVSGALTKPKSALVLEFNVESAGGNDDNEPQG